MTDSSKASSCARRLSARPHRRSRSGAGAGAARKSAPGDLPARRRSHRALCRLPHRGGRRKKIARPRSPRFAAIRMTSEPLPSVIGLDRRTQGGCARRVQQGEPQEGRQRLGRRRWGRLPGTATCAVRRRRFSLEGKEKARGLDRRRARRAAHDPAAVRRGRFAPARKSHACLEAACRRGALRRR